MKETVIKVVKGDDLDPNCTCQFCNKSATNIFGVINSKRFDGYLFSGFPVCLEHLDKLNALLSGEYDIDDLYLEKYKLSGRQGINLRA